MHNEFPRSSESELELGGTVGISKEVFAVLGKVAKSYWGDHRPAATAVEVKSLNGGVRLGFAVLAALPGVDV